MLKRFVPFFAIVALLVAGGLGHPQSSPLNADVQASLDRISPDSLRGHLSFIASDALEGRNTPSRGLDIAAEYIAAQFRRAGLTPAGDDGYFQTSSWLFTERDMSRFQFVLRRGDAVTRIAAEDRKSVV